MTFEFHSRHFELVMANVTMIRQPGGPGLEIPWAAETLPLTEGQLRDVVYDGVAGRLFAMCENVRVRRRSDVREYLIPLLPIIVDVMENDVRIQRSTAEVPEHTVVILRVIDETGRPMPKAELNVLSALPESVSFGGTTNHLGEFAFLAKTGMYSVSLGPEHYSTIEIAPSESGERLVVIGRGSR